MNQQEVAQVISVLKALYQSSDSGSKKQANDWLQDFQRKPSAWTTCDAILSAPLTELQNEAKLFAAQTLRNKIINDLRDLDSSAVISLRDSLVNYIKNVRTLPQNLITQVCLSLADIAVQSEAWTNPVADITQQFSADPYLVTCLLEFLTVLPEEVFNDRIVISDDVYRRRSNLLLTSQAANIIDIMVRCLQSSNLDPTTHVRVLSCFTSWIKCGELALGTMKNTPLIELAFAALDSTDETIFDTAVDAVCGIIYESRDAVRPLESSGGAGGDPSIIEQDILPRMAIVADKMRSDEAVTKDADEDRIRGYCRIFAEAGEAWLPEIVKKQGVYEKLLTALIDCMRLPHLEVIRMFFNMWGDMATQVLDHACRGQEYIHKAYIPVFEALIDVIIVHLQYPLEYDGFSLPSGGNAGRWTAQERDEFRDFRHEVGDVLKDCVRVVGDETALMHPFRLISAKISESSGSPQQTPWQIVEASLFALRVMGAEVSPNEDKILPKLMDMFSNFPAHPKLRYAATLVIARYTEWTNKHPQYVPFQLGYVSQGFQDHNIAPASALAIKYLAKDCSAQLVPVWKDLLSFYFQAFSTRVLGDLDMLQVTEALAHVISASPPADAAGKVEEFFAPLLKDLSEKLDQGATTTDSEKRAIIELVERMGVLIDYLDIDASSPSMEVLRQAVMTLCPLLLRILGSNAAHPALSESTARVLRTLIMVCSAMVSQMVPSFIETIVVSFQQTGYGVYLWLLRKIIEVYGNGRDGRAITAATATSGGSGSGNYDALIIQAVEKATEIVLQALQDPATVQSHPETIDEYFRTLSMGLSIMPRSIIQMPSFQPLFKFAIAALSVKQFEALDSVIYFWIRLVSPSVRHLENVKTRRERGDSTLSGQRHFPSPHSPGFHQCHSSGDDQDDYDYPIDQVVGAVSVCGFELTQALMEGLLYTFPPDFMSDASRILVSVAEIICLGLEFAPNAVIPPPSPASQSFSTIQPQQQPVFMEWMQSLILQIPDVNMNSRDRQLFLSDFSSALRAQDWNRSKRLLNDFRSIYRRKNSRAEKLN